MPRRTYGLELRLRCGAVSLDELAGLAGVSERKLRDDAAKGELTFVRRGSRNFVPAHIAQAYLGLDIEWTPHLTEADPDKDYTNE